MTNKKMIGIYQTKEHGATLFDQYLRESLLRLKLDKRFEIVPINSSDIQNKHTMNNLAGLAMPGRNSGQLYRDEWSERGYKNIHEAVEQHGMNIMAVCAASAVLCQKVSWHNNFQVSSDKYVENPHALFPGTAVGAFDNIWQDGYRSIMTQPDAYRSNVLAAKVLPVEYTSFLTNEKHNVKGHSLYWGGCVFSPDQEIKDDVRVLAKHDSRVSIPLVNQQDVSINKATVIDFIQPAAVIEFTVGKGDVIFSNIHPEVRSNTFNDLFSSTPRARHDIEAFNADKDDMLKSDHFSAMIFDRFVMNCAAYRKKSTRVKKPLLV